MPGTSAGASNSTWVAHLRSCAKDYHAQKGEKGDAQPRKAGGAVGRSSPPAKAKAREVGQEIRKEKAATKTRHAAAGKALKKDDKDVRQAVKKTEAPARAAQKHKVASEEKRTKKGMNDEATARALKTVQERRAVRRRMTGKSAPPKAPARQRVTGKSSAFLLPGY